MYYLTHYYKTSVGPFKSLSALPEDRALEIMKELYTDAPLWGRFKDPLEYIRARRETEAWVKEIFEEKGGIAKEDYPVYMVFGSSDTLDSVSLVEGLSKIQVPLEHFSFRDVSFTYIDSMYSYRLDKERPKEFYQPEYHGKVYLLSELLSLISEKGEPVDGWWGNLPGDFIPYIEAQVWNHDLLYTFLEEQVNRKFDKD